MDEPMMRKMRLKLVLMVYTALFLTGLLNSLLEVQSFALAPFATRNKISSASTASQLRRNILSNDFYRRRKRKFTEIYQESGNGKDSGNSFKSDSVQKLLNFDQDSNIEDNVLEYSYFDGESETEGIDDATMEEIIQGQPSEWNIMKEVSTCTQHLLYQRVY
mmetsp:Transcript_8093/g.8939  ORF Transcript_8093/g.8939 Transcript_8093/m.8939 type:complete len:162 (-) Transcript_8093:1073-1558(-)